MLDLDTRGLMFEGLREGGATDHLAALARCAKTQDKGKVDVGAHARAICARMRPPLCLWLLPTSWIAWQISRQRSFLTHHPRHHRQMPEQEE